MRRLASRRNNEMMSTSYPLPNRTQCEWNWPREGRRLRIKLCELIPSKIKNIQFFDRAVSVVCAVCAHFSAVHTPFFGQKWCMTLLIVSRFIRFLVRLRRLCSPQTAHVSLVVFAVVVLFPFSSSTWSSLMDQRIFTFPINSGNVKLRPEILCAYRTSRKTRSSVFVSVLEWVCGYHHG